MSVSELIQKAEQNMQICNACRYCEGFCAVFPAMTRRLTFNESDLHYLANLCHNCGSCFYACQFAPPHEFNVNVPRNFSQLRGETYRRYAWPGFLANLFERNGVAVSLITAFSLALFLLATFWLQAPQVVFAAHPNGDFYKVIPHGVMVWTFGLVSLYVLAALLIGFVRFWRDQGEPLAEFANPLAVGRALSDALRLKYLDGGGEGCTYPGEQPSTTRRTFHHFTFYGFMLCFAATSVATVYHYVFGWIAPYPYLSLPVALGTLGGIGLLIGPLGLLWLKSRRDPETAESAQRGMDNGFLVLLFLTSLTGLSLLFLRETAAMGTLLAVHLGVVMGLFLTLPYGKFVHAVYRFAALVRYALERARPAPDVTFE
jgi:citrate/tricarballylate utilization protein